MSERLLKDIVGPEGFEPNQITGEFGVQPLKKSNVLRAGLALVFMGGVMGIRKVEAKTTDVTKSTSGNVYTCAELMAPPGPNGESAGPGYNRYYNNVVDPYNKIYCIVDSDGNASLTHGPLLPNSTPEALP